MEKKSEKVANIHQVPHLVDDYFEDKKVYYSKK